MNKKIKNLLCLVMVGVMVPLTIGCGNGKDTASKPVVQQDEDILWTFKTEGEIYSSPVMYNNSNIIFGSNDKNIYSVDINTKNKSWSFNVDKEMKNKPVIDGDNVIVSSLSSCYMLDAKTGQQLWKFTDGGNVVDKVDEYDYHTADPKIYNDLVVFPAKSGTLYGLNKETGEKKWELKLPNNNMITVMSEVYENKVALGGNGSKGYIVDLDTQKITYTKDMGKPWVHGAAIYDGYAYFSGRSCNVVAIDLSNNSVKWQYTEPIGSWFSGQIIGNDGKVYVPGSDSHELLAFDAKKGTLLQKYESRVNMFSEPIIVDNVLYMGVGDVYGKSSGLVIGYDLKDNSKIVSHLVNKSLYSTPVVKDGVVYFTATDGVLYAGKAKNR